MECYINDLSLNNGASGLNLDNTVNEFIKVCTKLKEESFEKILVMPNFTSANITDSYNLKTITDTYDRGNILRTRLISLIKNQISEIYPSNDYEPYKEVKFNNKESSFLKYALINDAPIVSFQTDSLYSDHLLKANVFTINGNYSTNYEEPDIVNFSNNLNVDYHKVYLASKLRENIESDKNWNPLEAPFRLIDKMNTILSQRDYTNLKMIGNQSQKMALYFEVGSEIALLNGWALNNQLSTRNSSGTKKRKIFKAKNGYLSLDFMHGAFELHDSNGKHITEYDFNGVDNNKHYTDGSHNIEVN